MMVPVAQTARRYDDWAWNLGSQVGFSNYNTGLPSNGLAGVLDIPGQALDNLTKPWQDKAAKLEGAIKFIAVASAIAAATGLFQLVRRF